MLELLTYWDPRSPFEYCLAISFFGLSLDWCPCVWPWSSIFGNLSLPMRFTWPKYVNLRAFNKSTMSFSINNYFSVSTFLLLSFLVIPQIFLSTDLSNTLNFLSWCSFRVHVSELYWTRNTFCGTWYLPHSRVHKSIAELCSNFGDSAITRPKGQIAYFSLRMR